MPAKQGEMSITVKNNSSYSTHPDVPNTTNIRKPLVQYHTEEKICMDTGEFRTLIEECFGKKCPICDPNLPKTDINNNLPLVIVPENRVTKIDRKMAKVSTAVHKSKFRHSVLSNTKNSFHEQKFVQLSSHAEIVTFDRDSVPPSPKNHLLPNPTTQDLVLAEAQLKTTTNTLYGIVKHKQPKVALTEVILGTWEWLPTVETPITPVLENISPVLEKQVDTASSASSYNEIETPKTPALEKSVPVLEKQSDTASLAGRYAEIEKQVEKEVDAELEAEFNDYMKD